VTVLDQDVDASVAFDRRFDEPLAARSIREIRWEGKNVAAQGPSLARNGFEPLLAASRDDEIRTFAGEEQGDVAAETGTDTGDEGDLVLEEHVFLSV
jgi:hypothetical protein